MSDEEQFMHDTLRLYGFSENNPLVVSPVLKSRLSFLGGLVGSPQELPGGQEIDLEPIKVACRKYLAEQHALFYEPPLTEEEQIKLEQQYQRDTHFIGFARLLEEEIMQVYDRMDIEKEGHLEITRESQRVIARRAYDLVQHVIQSRAQGLELLGGPDYIAEQVALIPDMTEFPKDD